MGNKINMIGKRFGKLTVISQVAKLGKNLRYRCSCDCGKIIETNGNNLRSGGSTNCGCVRAQKIEERLFKHGHARSGSGKPTSEYRAWCAMRERCCNPKKDVYKHYGARGIKVCDRWLNSFESFLSDMGLKPTPKHSIDRKNNNGNYTPKNCRWATNEEQQRNRRNNIHITHNGKTMILAEWAKQFKMDKGTLRNRLIRQKLPFEEAISKPLRRIL